MLISIHYRYLTLFYAVLLAVLYAVRFAVFFAAVFFAVFLHAVVLVHPSESFL
jgi:integral membrane sensor domain MASE1